MQALWDTAVELGYVVEIVTPEQLWEPEPDLAAEIARADEIFKSV